MQIPSKMVSGLVPWSSVTTLTPANNGSTLAFSTLNLMAVGSGEVDVNLPNIVDDSISIGRQVFATVQAGNAPHRGIVRRVGGDVLLVGRILSTELVWSEGVYTFTCAGSVGPGVGLWFVQQASGERSDEQVIVAQHCVVDPLSFTVSGSGADQTLTSVALEQFVVNGIQLTASETVYGSVFLFGQTDTILNGLYALIQQGEDGVSPWVLRRHPFLNRRGHSDAGKVVVIGNVPGDPENGSIFVSQPNSTVGSVNMGWARAGGVSGGGVTSFNSRTGDVLPEQDDYTAGQVTFAPDGNITATDTQAAVVEVRDDAATALAAERAQAFARNWFLC